MKLENKNILIISNEPWGDVWFSKHHYAHALSQKNKIFFLNSPVKWQILNLFNFKIQENKINDSLVILSYSNFFPLTGKSKLLFHLNNWLISKRIKRYLTKKDAKEFIFWSFDPIRLLHPRLMRPTVSIYHSMDYYSHAEREAILSKNVDIILAVSESILTKLKNFNKKCFIIPHGIQNNELTPDELSDIPTENIALFIGSINERLNFKLLLQLSEEFKDCSFRLIGPINQKYFSVEDKLTFNSLLKQNNVIFTGPVPYSKLHTEILRSRICFSFTKQNAIANSLNSLKILQYLSYGKKVISNYFESYKNVSADIVQICNEKEYINKFGQMFYSSRDKNENLKRIEFANRFLYSNLIDEIGIIITKNSRHSKNIN
jgi:hypothetical protein